MVKISERETALIPQSWKGPCEGADMSSLFTPAVQSQAACLGALLARIVTEYYQDTQHRKEFEIWYKKTYGKPYQWKK